MDNSNAIAKGSDAASGAVFVSTPVPMTEAASEACRIYVHLLEQIGFLLDPLQLTTFVLIPVQQSIFTLKTAGLSQAIYLKCVKGFA